jgi:protein tyrosine/serine phosphatase
MITHGRILSLLQSFFLSAPSKFGDYKSSLAPLRIKNFGDVDEKFCRGSKPRKKDLERLSSIGITTIIDLREQSDSREESGVAALRMRYINIPMSDRQYPSSETIHALLRLINETATGKIFVHCAGGRHRTGLFFALYRLSIYRWDYDRVYSEMKSYDFYTRWGHGRLKSFVQDYAHVMLRESSCR